MKLSYKKLGIIHEPITYWGTDEKTNVAIYQGFRGENPELDFIVKYKEEGKRLRTPSHTHWIVDLLVKCETNKTLVLEYVNDLITIYDNSQPFTSVEQRNGYNLVHTLELVSKYWNLNSAGYYTIATLTSFIELFSICEKQTTGAFMFRDLLNLVKEYCEGKKDFYQVVGHSKRV
jgi:hypothetical protein